MNIRNGRLRTFAVLGTLTTLAFSSVQAGQVTVVGGATEDQLLGITLRKSTFRDVLKKYGQPTEVQAGGPFLPVPPKSVTGAAAPAGGGDGGFGSPGRGKGGMPGSGGGMSSGGGMGSGAGSGKRVTSKNGFPGENDNSAGGGGAAGAGRQGDPGPGGPGSGGYPGSGGQGGPAPGGGKGGGLPGFRGGSGGPGSGGGAPGSGEGGGDDQAADLPSTESTWWYTNAQKGYHMSFLFNKMGQVIQIQEYGGTALPNGKTRLGITLGSNMTQVLAHYGWSNDGAHDGENVIMRYGAKDKVAFQMVKNRVLGITIAVGQ